MHTVRLKSFAGNSSADLSKLECSNHLLPKQNLLRDRRGTILVVRRQSAYREARGLDAANSFSRGITPGTSH